MSTARDRAHKHAETHATRKVSEAFAAPWRGENDADEMIAIRELDATARVQFMSAVDIDSSTASARMDLNLLLPYVTELIVDAESHEPVFEIADHDWLMNSYPALVSKAVLTAVSISDIGDTADEAAQDF